MELQQLRYVIAVAEEQNFTRAAERCFVVQSALSHQIKALEKEIGVTLFARTSRRVELTPAGSAFLPYARTSVDAAQRAITEANAANGRICGELRIGIIPTLTAIDPAATVAHFHRQHPDVHISIRSGSSDEFMAAISQGELDVAFLGLPADSVPENVEAHRLSWQQLVAVLPEGHSLANRTELTLADFIDQPFVDFPTGSPGRAQTDLTFTRAGLTREVAFEITSADLMVGLIRNDLGVGFLSPAAIPDTTGLITRPVSDGPARVEYLAWSQFNPTPAAVAFTHSAIEALVSHSSLALE